MKKKAAKKAHKKVTHIPKAKPIKHENMNIKFHHDRHFGSNKHNSHQRKLSDESNKKHVETKKNYPKINTNTTDSIPMVTNVTNSTSSVKSVENDTTIIELNEIVKEVEEKA